MKQDALSCYRILNHMLCTFTGEFSLATIHKFFQHTKNPAVKSSNDLTAGLSHLKQTWTSARALFFLSEPHPQL